MVSHRKYARKAGWKAPVIEIWDPESDLMLKALIEHTGDINCLEWAPHSHILASAGDDEKICLWDAKRAILLNVLKGHTRPIFSISWSPDGKVLSSVGLDKTVRLWNAETGQALHTFEGHTDHILSVSFSADGRLLASKSDDGTVRLYNMGNAETLAELAESSHGGPYPPRTLGFHPSCPVLATLGQKDRVIRVWDIEFSILFGVLPIEPSVSYTSAKIVLVGESNVGKSCLAMRLAEDRYPTDQELGTTHGMRFLRVEAENLHPSAKAPPSQRRDVVLWDFGGQDEYQLVHQMFLRDTTLALIIIDPTRARAAFDEARDWNRRLEKHLGAPTPTKLLVGAKVDRQEQSELIDRTAIDSLREECGFLGFYETSALTGRGIEGLRKAVAEALDWDNLAETHRPELFQRILDDL